MHVLDFSRAVKRDAFSHITACVESYNCFLLLCYEEGYLLNLQKDQGHFQPITDC